MTADEINQAIGRAVEGIRAGHKFEMSTLENKLAVLEKRVLQLEQSVFAEPKRLRTSNGGARAARGVSKR